MKHFNFLIALVGIFSIAHLAADTHEETKGTQVKQPKYVISMVVEEVGSDGAPNKVVASPVFECEDGMPAKLTIQSSDFDQSNHRSIEVEARINSND